MLNQPESMEAPAPRIAINKVDTRLDRTSYGGTAFFVSLPFIAIGAFFTLAGFLEWEVLKEGANAPLWVIGAVGLIFLLSGLLLFSLAVRGLWSARRQSRLEQRYPGEPWRYDYHWDEFEVQDEAWGRVARGAVGVVVLSVFLVPFVWWAYFSNEGVLPVRIVTGVFILLWLVITGTAIYRVIQYLKFGTSRLILSQFPCRPGDPVRLYLPGDHLEGARCRLRYVEERIEWRGQGKQRTASHLCDEIHGESRAVLDAAGGQGNGAILEFTLPDNRQWTNSLVAAPTIRYWELLVESELAGIDFRTTFLIPVYDVPREKVRRNATFGWQGSRAGLVRRLPGHLKLVTVVLVLLAGSWLLLTARCSGG